MTAAARDRNVWGSVRPAVPQQIVDQTINLLPDTPEGLKALISASLRIDLRDSNSEPTKLDILLQGAPHLLRYVQVLRVTCDVYRKVGLFARSTTLPTSLKALQSEGSHRVTLRRIELHGVDWQTMSSGMQAVLLDLFACGSLRKVGLHGVSSYPTNFIDRLPPALKSLDISDTDFPLITAFRHLLKLETLSIRSHVAKHNQSITGNVWQLTRLRSLELSTCGTTLWPVYRDIIQHVSSSLEELYILIYITAEHFDSVDFSQFPRIRKIVIITARVHNELLACLASFRAAIVWLSQSLSNVSHDNNIQQVTIRFCVSIVHDRWYDAGIERAAWESLDETLSQPNFALFRGMNLQICADTQDVYDYLDGLVHANLPRTERSKKLHVTKERFSDIRYDLEDQEHVNVMPRSLQYLRSSRT